MLKEQTRTKQLKHRVKVKLASINDYTFIMVQVFIKIGLSLK